MADLQHCGEDYDELLVSLMMKEYGDLLQVSRSRGVRHSLPQLRIYIKQYAHLIVDMYEDSLKEEISGVGLATDTLLNTFVQKQVESFRLGHQKNTSLYATEIKKKVKTGATDIDVKTVEGTSVLLDENNNEMGSLYDKIIKKPYEISPDEIDRISSELAKKVREYLLSTFRKFSLWTFGLQMGFPFQEQDFHALLFDTGQKVVDGEIDRLVVTIPPRHSKTQIFSICLPLYSFCVNPHSHNIITSYADDVVNESSGYVRAVLQEELFQKIFPNTRIDPSKKSLERWGTTKQGVFHAVPTGGKMTGKGAGLLTKDYAGCFVVDDAIKPKDAYSDAVRNEINDRFNNTFLSRLANDGVINDEHGNEVKSSRTPMVVIMQRVHDNDLVGYILRGGSTDEYHYLNIPAIVEEETGSEEYYKKLIDKHRYSHAIPVTYKLERKEYPCALWAARKSLSTLQMMEKTDPYTYNSQYAGDPSGKGIGLIQESWLRLYKDVPYDEIATCFMTADTAATEEDYSDYSVVIYWAQMSNGDLYALDALIGKFEIDPLKKAIGDFWDKHNVFDIFKPTMMPTALYMEKKSSGLYLNQQFVKDNSITCIPIERDRSSGNKVTRFMNTIPYFAQGKIWFPEEHEHIVHIKREVMGMTQYGNTTGNDDVCDCISDATVVAYVGDNMSYERWL